MNGMRIPEPEKKVSRLDVKSNQEHHVIEGITRRFSLTSCFPLPSFHFCRKSQEREAEVKNKDTFLKSGLERVMTFSSLRVIASFTGTGIANDCESGGWVRSHSAATTQQWGSRTRPVSHQEGERRCTRRGGLDHSRRDRCRREKRKEI